MAWFGQHVLLFAKIYQLKKIAMKMVRNICYSTSNGLYYIAIKFSLAAITYFHSQY